MRARRGKGYVWRITLVLLLALGTIPAMTATPAEAQAVPDGICDVTAPPQLVLIQCADEAAAAGLSVSKFVARYGWAFAGGAGIVGLVLIEAWALEPPESMGECLDRFPEIGERGCRLVGVKDGSPWWITDEMREAVGSLFDPIDAVCSVLPILPGCTTTPEPGGELWRGDLPTPTKAGPLGVGQFFTYTPVTANDQEWSVLLAGPVPPDGEALEIYRTERPSNGRYLALTIEQGVDRPGAPNTGVRVRLKSQSIGLTQDPAMTLTVPEGGWEATRYFAIGIHHPAGSPHVEVTFGNSDAVAVGVDFQGSRWSSGPGGGHQWASSAFNTLASVAAGDSVTHSFADGWGIQTWFGEGSPDRDALGGQIGFLDPLISPGSPPAVDAPGPQSPFPEVPAPPAEPVPWNPPVEVPAPVPVPEAEPYSPVTEGAGDEGLFDQLANRIGGIIDGLASGIGGAFGWLGDLISDLFSWLVDRLWEMFHWLFDSIEQLIQWLGGLLESLYVGMVGLASVMATLFNGLFNVLGELFEALGRLLSNLFEGLGDLLGTIGDFILGLPQAIIDLLGPLFIPSGLPEFAPCADTFPCNWVAEAVDMTNGLATGLASGGCEAPSVGWSEFRASFPPPPGCSGGNAGAAGANDSTAGDLFGWRSSIRTILALSLWVGFIRKMLELAPWSRRGDMPLGEGQVTI